MGTLHPLLIGDLTQVIVSMALALLFSLLLLPLLRALRLTGSLVVTVAVGWIVAISIAPIALEWTQVFLGYLRAASRYASS
jgi:hypothetical protein